jgi:shikimate kinase
LLSRFRLQENDVRDICFILRQNMIIYLVGISCVGKSTIGNLLAKKLNYTFFDLDLEVEKYYQKAIEIIQDECITMNEYRQKASMVLDKFLSKNGNFVISGTPSGLKYSYFQVYKRHKKIKDLYSIVIVDKAENILNRLTFYDKDSKPMEVILDKTKKKRYLIEIKRDYNFFRLSYKRADLQLNIENVPLEEIPDLIIQKLNKIIGLPAANSVSQS